MSKPREFEDKNREVMDEFYDLSESYSGGNGESIKKRLKKLIEKDPDFLDSHVLLYQILQDEDNPAETEKILDEAYNRAIKLITDKHGNWPDVLEWGWLENRHIIRAILNKAILLWDKNKTEEALDIFRKLLKTNPGDNVGARDFILAIRMNMTYKEYEKRFNKGGYYDNESADWFNKNYKKFPDEFSWWEKAVEKYG